MDIKLILKKSISSALNKLEIEHTTIHLEHPEDLSFGDFSTNIALVLAKSLGENPVSLAEKIVEEIKKDLPKEIKKVEVKIPGFINFFLGESFFENSLKEILRSRENFGKGDLLSGKIALFEYTDANAFKPFHIGHLMSNAVGETLSRLGEFQGADVKRLCYGGDVGLHVAKCVWGMQKNKAGFPHDTDDLHQKMKFLGDSYVYGSSAYEEDEEAKKEITKINKKIFEHSDPELEIYYTKGKEWSVLHLREIYKMLGTNFHKEYFESEMVSDGVGLVNNHKEIFVESEGAIVFKGEDHGLHTRVFINSGGLPTYETKELGLFLRKQKDFPQYDFSLTVTANEQNDYFKVLTCVFGLLFPNEVKKFVHVSHGMLRFKEGKMSSRKGNIIAGDAFVEEVYEEVRKKMVERDMSQDEKDLIAKKVALSAVKFTVLRQSPGKDIIFDREKALSFEGDSGPYLLYTLVRAKAVLKKAKEVSIESKVKEFSNENLERLLYRFPEIVNRAFQEKAPNIVVDFIQNLCAEFNSFYTRHKIADSENENAPHFVAITEAFINVLRNGLNILAIQEVEKM